MPLSPEAAATRKAAHERVVPLLKRAESGGVDVRPLCPTLTFIPITASAMCAHRLHAQTETP